MVQYIGNGYKKQSSNSEIRMYLGTYANGAIFLLLPWENMQVHKVSRATMYICTQVGRPGGVRMFRKKITRNNSFQYVRISMHSISCLPTQVPNETVNVFQFFSGMTQLQTGPSIHSTFNVCSIECSIECSVQCRCMQVDLRVPVLGNIHGYVLVLELVSYSCRYLSR